MLTYDAISGAGLVASIMAGAEATIPGDIFEIMQGFPGIAIPGATLALLGAVSWYLEAGGWRGLKVRFRRARSRWRRR